ncbi:MAG: hypothetical protein V7752_12050 [Halopseudomonas sp.]
MLFQHQPDTTHYRKNRRHLADRRHPQDRREEVRFEPNKPNRRQITSRRHRDSDPWKAASREH